MTGAKSGKRVVIAATMALGLLVSACGRPDKTGEAKPGAAPAAPDFAVQLDPCQGEAALNATVCANKSIAPLTAEVSGAFAEVASAVSPEGAKLVLEGQRQWLAAARLECKLDSGGAEAIECLKMEMAERAKAADEAVQKVGPFTFQRVETVDAAPVTAEAASASGLGDEAPAAITRELRFPRIDGATSPQIEAFNRAVARMGEPRFSIEDQTNEEVDYTITFASPELISVRFTKYDYALGAAHPNGTEESIIMLMATGEPLTPGDVFAVPEARWKSFLASRSLRALRESLKELDEGIELDPKDVAETATKTHHWVVTEKALVILFPPYSIGPYALGSNEVAIPWADMKDLIRPDAPPPFRQPA